MAMEQIYTGVNHEGVRTFQRASYIEDGWYITEEDGGFKLWDIPLYGGDPQLRDTFDTFDEAIKFNNANPYT